MEAPPPLPYPALPLQVGRFTLPIRLTFGAIAEIRETTGADWLAGRGMLGADVEHLYAVLNVLTRHAGAPAPWKLRLLRLLQRDRARIAAWAALTLVCREHMPQGVAPDKDEDSRSPGKTAVPLEAVWGVAHDWMGVSETDFWSLTPRQFECLSSAHSNRQKRDDYRAGVVASTLANCHKGRDADSFSPRDFFPSLGGGDDEPTDGDETPPSHRELAETALKNLDAMSRVD